MLTRRCVESAVMEIRVLLATLLLVVLTWALYKLAVWLEPHP